MTNFFKKEFSPSPDNDIEWNMHRVKWMLNFIYLLPPKLIYWCMIRAIAETTTGKYENTIVPNLGAMEAVSRFARIYAMRGHGKDSYYDSNRLNEDKV